MMTVGELRKEARRLQKIGGYESPREHTARCEHCGALGLVTGLGYWLFGCGAEVLSDGEIAKHCPKDPD